MKVNPIPTRNQKCVDKRNGTCVLRDVRALIWYVVTVARECAAVAGRSSYTFGVWDAYADASHFWNAAKCHSRVSSSTLHLISIVLYLLVFIRVFMGRELFTNWMMSIRSSIALLFMTHFIICTVLEGFRLECLVEKSWMDQFLCHNWICCSEYVVQKRWVACIGLFWQVVIL